MYFFPLASKTPPFPLLCTLYNSLMTLSAELVGWALCAAGEKRLPKITSRGINEKLIVLIVSVPQKSAILRKHTTLGFSCGARSECKLKGKDYLRACYRAVSRKRLCLRTVHLSFLPTIPNLFRKQLVFLSWSCSLRFKPPYKFFMHDARYILS